MPHPDRCPASLALPAGALALARSWASHYGVDEAIVAPLVRADGTLAADGFDGGLPPLALGCDPAGMTAYTAGQQLRAVAATLAVAAWVAGADVSGYPRERGWYSVPDVRVVLPHAQEAARSPAYRALVLEHARGLWRTWTAAKSKPHGCGAQIAWSKAQLSGVPQIRPSCAA